MRRDHYLRGSALASRVTERVIDAGLRTTDDGAMTNNTTTSPDHTDSADPLTAVIDLHLRAYCEPDPTRRAALVAAAWRDDGQLLDPPFDGAGHAAIADMADVVLTHYPAHTFRRTTTVDAHHSFARYGWSLEAADGSVAVTGIDIVETATDGRLQRVIGFFGDLA
ncbi:MAG: hypothetical protein RJA49_2556 [Actinomycetota bacterium]